MKFSKITVYDGRKTQINRNYAAVQTQSKSQFSQWSSHPDPGRSLAALLLGQAAAGSSSAAPERESTAFKTDPHTLVAVLLVVEAVVQQPGAAVP